MKSTRDRILHTLLKNPHSTIEELAKAVKINTISVRHHLTSLLAEGLIAAEEERHGVGRPRQIYFLSEKGIERFPTHYLSFTNRLLDEIKEVIPTPVYEKLLVQMANRQGKTVLAKIETLPLEEKMKHLQEFLLQEGFDIEWKKEDEQYQITGVTCPYYHISRQHPEICTMDQALISTLLAVPVERKSCILNGDTTCTYTFRNTDKPQ